MNECDESSERHFPAAPRWFLLLCLVGLTAAFPLLFTTKTLEAGAIRPLVSQIAVAGLVGLVLLYYLFSGRCVLPPEGVLVALLAIPLITAFGCLSISPSPAAGLPECWRVLTLALLACLAALAFQDAAARKILLAAIGLTACGISIYAIGQKLGYDPVAWSQSSSGRVFGTIGNPNMLAAYCVICLPLLVFGGLGLKGWTGRIGAMVAAALLGVALILTRCRGAWIGVGAAAVTAITIYRKTIFASGRRALIVGVAVLAVAGAASVPFVSRMDDLSRLGQKKTSSANVRLVIWRGAWNMIKDNPWMGVGPGQFKVRFPRYREPSYEQYGLTHNTLHAHSEPLELLAELGIVGFVVCAGAMGWILWRGFGRLPAEEGFNFHLLAGLLCGVVGLLGHNLVSVNLRWPTAAYFFALFVGLIGGFMPTRRLNLSGWRRGVAAPVCLVVCALLAMGAKRYARDRYRSEVLTMAGRQAHEKGRWETARQKLQKAIARAPTNVRARYHLAYTYFQQKQFEKAIEAYHDLQTYSPDYCQVHYNLAACHLNLGQWERAARQYGRQRKIGGLPEGFHFESLLSTLRSKKSQQEKYYKSLKHLVAINPEEITARNLLGNYQYRRGRMAKARKHYRAILRQDKENVPALNNLAGVHFANEEYGKARNICRRIVKITPKKVVPWINLGKALYMLGDDDRAREAWQQAKELAPHRGKIDEYLQMVAGSQNR